MKRFCAAVLGLSLASAAALPVAHADLVASLNASWDGPPAVLESGSELVARVDWDANYAHGYIDGEEPASTAFDLTVRSGRFLGLPEQCSDASEWGPTSVRCVLDTPDDDGIAGHIAVPVRAWGSAGDSVSVSVVDSHGNAAATPELEMTATAGIDIALNPTGISEGGYRFNKDLQAETVVPVMIALPYGAEPLAGEVTFDLAVDTSAGPSVASSLDRIEIVPVPDSPSVTGIAANGSSYEVPVVSHRRLDASTVRLTVEISEESVGPASDPAGGILDTVPVASFGITFHYPAYSPSLRNTAVSWRAEVVGWTASTASGPISQQLRTTNDASHTSIVDVGSVSAKFVNGHAPDSGGILAEPGDDPMRLPQVHRDVWDPEQGTGTLAAGANHWLGRGPILPGDQLVGIVNASHYVGMEPGQYAPGTTHGYCLIFDRERGSTSYNGKHAVTDLSSYRVEYLTGAIPGGFMSPDCGKGTWTAERPADVTAMRVLFDPAAQDAPFATRPIFGAGYLVSEGLGEGERAWMAGGHSTDISRGWDMMRPVVSRLSPSPAAPTYTSTTTFRDAVEAVPYRTTVQLAASVDTVSPGDSVDWLVRSQISAAPFADRGEHSVVHRLVLPPGVELTDAGRDATVTTEGGRQVVTWTAPMLIGTPETTTISTVYRSGTGTLTAQVGVENMTSTRLGQDSDTADVVALASAGTHLSKTTQATEFALDGSNRWLLTLENRDVWPVSTADTIDILPYEGDGRSTLTSAQIAVTGLTGEEIWVSTADPASLDPDPLAAANGTVGRPSALWQPWEGQEGVTAVRWITRDLGPGMTVDYSIDYSVSGATNGDVLVNSAQTRTSGALTTMINSSSTTNVGPPADLQVDKRLVGDDAVLAAGEELTFEITARGAGPGTVRGAVLADIPTEGLEDVEFVEASQGTFDGGIWRIGDLPEDSVVTAVVRATVLGGPVTNVIVGDTCEEECFPVLPPSCEPNVDVYSDTDRCDLVELEENPILQIDKALIGGLPDEGEVRYAITVRNGAQAEDGVVTAATLVSAHDLTGAGLDPASAAFTELSQGSADGPAWQIGTLRPGQEATAVVTAELLPDAQRAVNAIAVSSPVLPRELTDPGDAIPNDDVYSDTDQADVVDTARDGRLAINKEVDSVDGDVIRFSIDVGNLGGAPISGVSVTDIPGEDLHDAVLDKVSVGSVDGLIWSVGDLEPGQTETAYVSGRISPAASRVSNEALVESEGFPHGGTFIPNPTLETDTDQGDAVVTELPVADLRLDKRLIDIDGSTAVFEIETCNVGLTAANAVTVTDAGGDGVTRLSSADDRFTDGVFILGVLDPGRCETLKVEAEVDGAGENVAFVDSPNDPIEDDADQPNESIEEDIDGWDIVEFDGAAARTQLPVTGAMSGSLVIGAGLLLALGTAAVVIARRRR